MPKTAAQKARRRARNAARRAAGIPKRKAMGPMTLKQFSKKIGSARKRAVKRAARQRGQGVVIGPGRSRGMLSYGKARGAMRGMKTTTDGISIMKTVHNSSVIEDHFALRREKVANIIGTTNTSLNVNLALYLNPGNSVLFPIFSQIASTYEQYRVETLVFSYETESYAASGSNVSAGKVILATDYNPSGSQFTSDTQMENYFNSDRGAPFCEIVHDVLLGDHALKDMPEKAYFVNSSANLAVPTGDTSSNKFYDLGLFQLATQANASASAEIGELYVTYSFTMIRPRQQIPLGVNLPSSHYVGAVPTTANAFVGSTQKAGSNLNIIVASNVITFNQVGQFFVAYSATSTTYTNGNPVLSGCAYFVPTSSVYTANSLFSAGNASAAYTCSFFLSVSVVGATYTMNQTIVGGLLWDIVISQVSSGLQLVKSEEDLVLEDRISLLEGRLAKFTSFFETHPLDTMESDEKSPDYVAVRRTPILRNLNLYSGAAR